MRIPSLDRAACLVALMVLLLGIAGGAVIPLMPEKDRAFIGCEIRFTWKQPSDAGENLAKLGQWVAWRVGVRSQPPDDYEFDPLIERILDSFADESS